MRLEYKNHNKHRKNSNEIYIATLNYIIQSKKQDS